MNYLKKLAGQTLVYGMGTIVPRLLNYLLMTPFFTNIFADSQQNYGTISELYGYTAILLAVLTYGMETTFFRFAGKDKNPSRVFSTAFFSILFTTTLFVVFTLLFAPQIAQTINHNEHVIYVQIFIFIIGLDAISAIPFTYLRQQEKAFRFSLIKIITVSINIGLNLFFFLYCPNHLDSHFIQKIYSPDNKVVYVFVANLIASAVMFGLLIPELVRIRWSFDWKLLKKMLHYTWPLLIVGFAGMLNENADKSLLKYFLQVPTGVADVETYKLQQQGIYAANFKIAVLMTLFVQMFRVAVEPFLFKQSGEKDQKQIYADVMKYFVIACLLLFLFVTLYIDIFKHFINRNYRDALFIVPIVLIAKIFFGILFNLSIWYKLKNLTIKGAVIAIAGALVTFIFLFWLVPQVGYLGAAWGQFACYFTMMLISYFWGQKHFNVPYDLKTIGFYFILALALYFVSRQFLFSNKILMFAFHFVLIGLFVGVVFWKERKNFKRIKT